MATRSLYSLLSNVHRTMLVQRVVELPDAQLLQAFVACRDEAAIAELVRRHGPMVLGVCRRVLQDPCDAEDAFQATFLVLIRKAAQVRPPSMVANWLHGVAYRAALKARALREQHARRERQVYALPERGIFPPEPWDDVRGIIDQELGRLADKHRLPVILCDLEGRSIKDTARQLGWPLGTVAGRLARARTLLARRLERRGLGALSCTVATMLAVELASAAVPPSLVAWTCKAAARPLTAATAVHISVKVTTLTRGVLAHMLWTKIKHAAIVPLILAVLGSGLWSTAALFSASPAEEAQSPAAAEAPAPKKGAPSKDIYRNKMFFVRMHLFDRGAKPAPGYVAVNEPGERKTTPDSVWRKSFGLILLRDGEQVKRLDGWTTRAWGIQAGKGPLADTYETGIYCDVMVRDRPSVGPGIRSWAAAEVALSVSVHKRDVEGPDNEEVVRDRTIEVVRKIRLGSTERVVLEKDSQGQPKSWLEVAIVRDEGTHPVRLRLRADAPASMPAPANSNPIAPSPTPTPLPKDSRGIPFVVGMEGVWTVTRIEADGQPLGAQAIDKFGKTLRCTQGWLATPGRGLFDLGWEMPFELNTSTTPRRITLRAKGPTGPLRFNGIYLLDGSDLTLCLNENGEDPTFPTEFKTKKGSPFVVFTCKWWGPTP